MQETAAYQGWAIVELMGHRRLAGEVSEAAQYGTAMLRIDVPAEGDQPASTKFFGGSAIYAVHPCDEAMARAVIRTGIPQPIDRYELRHALPEAAPIGRDQDDFSEDDSEDIPL